MIDKVSQRIFFGILLLAVTAAFLWLIRGFLQPIFWAIALGIVFYPVHARIQGLLSARQSLAAGLSLIMIVLIVILPLAGIAVAVTGEAASLYDRVRSGDINVSGAIDWIEQQVPQLVSTLDSFGIDSSNIRARSSAWARFSAVRRRSVISRTMATKRGS